MLLVRDDIFSKLISIDNPPTDAFSIEISLRKKMVTQFSLQSK